MNALIELYHDTCEGVVDPGAIVESIAETILVASDSRLATAESRFMAALAQDLAAFLVDFGEFWERVAVAAFWAGFAAAQKRR